MLCFSITDSLSGVGRTALQFVRHDHLSQGILILKVRKIGNEDEPLKCTTYRKDRKQIFIVKCYRQLFTETMELVLNRLFCFIIVLL